jgi:mono/diheme cytochrome c family protein
MRPVRWLAAAVGIAAMALVTLARATAAADADVPTFSRDVLPILQASCQDCHRPGQMAPFSLLTYDEARPWARAIRQRVAAREMPPWFSRRGVGEYDPDPSLTDRQIETIVKWVDGGSPPGNPADAPPPVQWPTGGRWRFGEPDLVLTAPPVVIPASGPDAYPEPEIETGLTEDRYIQWMEVIPEQPQVVHHVLVYATENGGDPADAAEGSRGRRLLANLAKGGTPRFWPDGAAKALRVGEKIRFQIHTHPNNESARVEHTKVGIKFFPRGYRPRHIINTKAVSSPSTLAIPPGDPNVRSDATFTLERPATLLSFQPHMHYRGKRMTLEALLPSGERRLLSDIDRFTQAWQPTYRYKHPPSFPAGTVLHVTAYHDNSAANKLNPDPTAFVAWGERTVDEMNIGWMDYYFVDDAVASGAAR